MLHNPYPQPLDSSNPESRRLQTDISAEDKSLLMSIWPVKGTLQLVVNNLIFNLCKDLRELTINSYRPDAPDILGVLVEPRQLSSDQCKRLQRCPSVGTATKIPKGIQQHQRGTELRPGATTASAGSGHPPVEADGGKQRVGKEKSEKKSGGEAKD